MSGGPDRAGSGGSLASLPEASRSQPEHFVSMRSRAILGGRSGGREKLWGPLTRAGPVHQTA